VNARTIAQDAGIRYVYVGNLRSDAENTYCHSCGKLIIERMGYFVKKISMTKGKCRHCATSIAGVWR